MKKLALVALAVHLPAYGMSWFPEEPEEPVVEVEGRGAGSGAGRAGGRGG